MSSLVTKQAPDFTAQAVMPDNSFRELKLSSYRGKYVVLFFYPISEKQLVTIESDLKERKSSEQETPKGS